MGSRVKITSGKDVNFDEGIITSVEFVSNTPDTSNVRSTDLGIVLKIKGRIYFSLGAEQLNGFCFQYRQS